MQPFVMVTNGGPHPAEKWAEIAAQKICDKIEALPDDPPNAGVERRTLELNVLKALIAPHAKVQAGERGKLKGNADRHRAKLDAGEHIDLDAVVKDVVAAAKGTMFAERFAAPEFAAFIRSELTGHFHSAMHVEREHHRTAAPAAG